MFKPNQCTPLPEHDKALKNRVTCKNIKREVIEKAARGRQPHHPMQLQHLCAQWERRGVKYSYIYVEQLLFFAENTEGCLYKVVYYLCKI